MKSEKEKFIMAIIISVIVIAAVIIFVVLSVRGKIENTPGSTFEESYNVDGIVFNNIDYYYSDVQTYITFSISNTTNETVTLGVYTIIARDKNGEELFTFTDILEEPLKAGEAIDRQLSTLGDFTSATSLEFVNNQEE